MKKRLACSSVLEACGSTAQALAPGSPAPAFEARASDGTTVRLADLKGRWVTIYFYPKAFTPGCTRQSCALRDGMEDIRKRNATVFGISLDRVETLERFKKEHSLPFELLSDSDKKISEAYGTLGTGGLHARRVTFLINPEGLIAAVLDKIDVSRHDREIIETLDALAGASSPSDRQK